MKQKIFIGSVQKEFQEERRALGAYLRGDALLSRFFEPFLFEEVPASGRRADHVYLAEVEECDIYIGLFGNKYGVGGKDGLSAVEQEFNHAGRLEKPRLIFVKGADDASREAKMRPLVQKAGVQLIRRRFATTAELIAAVYASLVQYLEDRELIRTGPFDATFCRNAALPDLDEDRIRKFLRHARRARDFPLSEDAEPKDVLAHLNLLDNGRPTHAAVLLFGFKPQRFLISSEVKCAHFHGIDVAKPIPSYQVYKGTVFELVDQAVDFVMSKINLAVGTRKHSTQAPVEYEIPQEVVREAIVNAVAHRDYTSNGSVQVMLFADRLEVWNPGSLPPSLTLKKLREPHGSVPANPLLAEPLYLTKYIERMGTGIRDMIKRCREAGLPEPQFALTDGFVTTIRRKPGRAFEAVGGKELQPESQYQSGTSPVPVRYQSLEERILALLKKDPLPVSVLSKQLGQKRVSGRLKIVLQKLLSDALIEFTIPDKPQSRLQKYRLTKKGRESLKKYEKKK